MKGFLQSILQKLKKKNNTWTIRRLVDKTIDPWTQRITYIEDCRILGNEEIMSTHCVVHRLLKNLSFFYCCFSVKANPLNPRTSPLCSLSYLRTMVGRNSKLCQFWNYFNLMLFSYFVHMFNLDEDNILDLHGDLHHNKIDCLNMFDHKLSWLHVKLVRFRAIGTSENPGVPVVIRWA